MALLFEMPCVWSRMAELMRPHLMFSCDDLRIAFSLSQPAGWVGSQSCVPSALASEERMLGKMMNVECRLSCASDPGCYCYAMVEDVCYSGYSECECAAARNSSCCVETGDDGFVMFKDMVRCACVCLAYLYCDHLFSASVLMYLYLQPAGWIGFQSCVPRLSDERVVGAVSNVECRLSCASDPGCYC